MIDGYLFLGQVLMCISVTVGLYSKCLKCCESSGKRLPSIVTILLS